MNNIKTVKYKLSKGLLALFIVFTAGLSNTSCTKGKDGGKKKDTTSSVKTTIKADYESAKASGFYDDEMKNHPALKEFFDDKGEIKDAAKLKKAMDADIDAKYNSLIKDGKPFVSKIDEKFLTDDKKAIDKSKLKGENVTSAEIKELRETIEAEEAEIEAKKPKPSVNDLDPREIAHKALEAKHLKAKTDYPVKYIKVIKEEVTKGTEDIKDVFNKDGELEEFDKIADAVSIENASKVVDNIIAKLKPATSATSGGGEKADSEVADLVEKSQKGILSGDDLSKLVNKYDGVIKLDKNNIINSLSYQFAKHIKSDPKEFFDALEKNKTLALAFLNSEALVGQLGADFTKKLELFVESSENRALKSIKKLQKSYKDYVLKLKENKYNVDVANDPEYNAQKDNLFNELVKNADLYKAFIYVLTGSFETSATGVYNYSGLMMAGSYFGDYTIYKSKLSKGLLFNRKGGFGVLTSPVKEQIEKFETENAPVTPLNKGAWAKFTDQLKETIKLAEEVIQYYKDYKSLAESAVVTKSENKNINVIMTDLEAIVSKAKVVMSNTTLCFTDINTTQGRFEVQYKDLMTNLKSRKAIFGYVGGTNYVTQFRHSYTEVKTNVSKIEKTIKSLYDFRKKISQ